MLRYTRRNKVFFVGANAFFPPPPLGGGGGGFSLGTLEKYSIRIKSVHDTGTEDQHQPRSCSHQNHYVKSGIPQQDRRAQLCIDAGGNHSQHLL